MQALITGGAGFVGRWLCGSLVESGWRVTATTLDAPPPAGRNAPDGVSWVHADLRVAADVERVLDGVTPDVVYHLAGLTFVPGAQRDAALAFEVNVIGAVRLLTALRERRRAGGVDPVVLVVGSAEEYGIVAPEELPLLETAPLRPVTPYGASKAAAEVVALQAFRGRGLPVVAARPFNHLGPGRPGW